MPTPSHPLSIPVAALRTSGDLPSRLGLHPRRRPADLAPRPVHAGRGPRVRADARRRPPGPRADRHSRGRGGRENIPRGEGVVFCANHESNVDAPILFYVLHPRLHVLYKAEFGRVPILGAAIRHARCVPVYRDDRDRSIRWLDEAVPMMRAGTSFLFHPEGTRSRPGSLLPFKKGGFIMAIQAQVPIVPVTIHGSYDAMRRGNALIFPATIGVRIGEPIETTGLTHDDRDALITDQVRIEDAGDAGAGGRSRTERKPGKGGRRRAGHGRRLSRAAAATARPRARQGDEGARRGTEGMMDTLVTLGRTLGFSSAAGINLYATVAILGLASRFGWVALPSAVPGVRQPLHHRRSARDVRHRVRRRQDSVGRLDLGHGAHGHPADRRRADCRGDAWRGVADRRGA